MSWKKQLEEALRSGMKYCFPTILGQFPTLDEAEFSGSPADSNGMGGESGFLDFVTDLVDSFRRKVFFKAYEMGVRDCLEDIKRTNPGFDASFDIDLNKIGASKRWEESER